MKKESVEQVLQEQNKPLKEKDIVNHIIKNWEYYIGIPFNICFHKTEFNMNIPYLNVNSRVDILGFTKVNINNKSKNYPCFLEVKYNNNSRDLLYELQNLLSIKRYHNLRETLPNCMIGVIIDTKSINPAIELFCKDNNILIIKYKLNISESEKLSKIEDLDILTKL